MQGNVCKPSRLSCNVSLTHTITCWLHLELNMQLVNKHGGRIDNTTTAFVASFRRMFYAYHQAIKPHHTNIILSLFSIPFVLKCAAKSLKVGLHIEI